MWHPHHQAWVDEETSADENWATRGSTARFTRRIYPAFTSAEKLYWEETGLVPPINTSQPTPTVQMSYGGSDGILAYNPFSKMNVIGGDQGGAAGSRIYHRMAVASLCQRDADQLVLVATLYDGFLLSRAINGAG
jgi:hypothetical protein